MSKHFIKLSKSSQQSIQSFSIIGASFTLMLETTKSSEVLTQKVFEVNNNDVIGSGGNRADKMVENLAKFKNIKNLSKVKKFKINYLFKFQIY